eukprot:3940908-Rhodomonas_salina.3
MYSTDKESPSPACAFAVPCPVQPTHSLCHVRYCLRTHYALPAIAYALAMPWPVQPMSVLCHVRYRHSIP